MDTRCLSVMAEAHALDGNLASAKAYLEELAGLRLIASHAALSAFRDTALALNKHAMMKWLSTYTEKVKIAHVTAHGPSNDIKDNQLSNCA